MGKSWDTRQKELIEELAHLERAALSAGKGLSYETRRRLEIVGELLGMELAGASVAPGFSNNLPREGIAYLAVGQRRKSGPVESVHRAAVSDACPPSEAGVFPEMRSPVMYAFSIPSTGPLCLLNRQSTYGTACTRTATSGSYARVIPSEPATVALNTSE